MEKEKATAALLLGTNMGDRLQKLDTARTLIGAKAGIITKTSHVYATAAWGIEEQADFLNQALLISTSLPPFDLLKTILHIEEEMGRIREVKWGPRLIDIDILYYDNMVLDSDALKVPHPFLSERRFTLIPLLEISPAWVHPVSGKNIERLLYECRDNGEVILYSQK